MLGKNTQLLKLGILKEHNLRQELIGPNEAAQVFLEQVQLIEAFANLLERSVGLLQANCIPISLSLFPGGSSLCSFIAKQLVPLVEALSGRLAVIAEFGCFSLGIEECPRKGLHLVPVVHLLGIQRFLDVIDHLGRSEER